MEKLRLFIVLMVTASITMQCKKDSTGVTLQVGFLVPDEQLLMEKCPIPFTNTSLGATTYSWDFGDGNTSNEESPFHEYESPATYTVSLTVSNGVNQQIHTQNIEVFKAETFIKRKDLGGKERISKVITTNDNSFVLFGHTNQGDQGFIKKVDNIGVNVWEYFYPELVIHSAVVAIDGGYIAAGQSRNSDASNFHLLKIDENGIKEWDIPYRINGEYNDFLTSVISTSPTSVISTSGYLLIGTRFLIAGGDHNGYVIKVDQSGVREWDMEYGGGNEYFEDGVLTDNGYLLVGRTNANGATGSTDAYFVEIDDLDGMIRAEGTSMGVGVDGAEAVVATSGNSFVTAGFYTPSGAAFYKAQLRKMNIANGAISIQWERNHEFLSPCVARDIIATPDGGFVMTGYTQDPDNPSSSIDRDFYLAKVDFNGDTLWQQHHGGLSTDEAFSIDITNDCGFIIGGVYDDKNSGNGAEDIYYIKTDGQGNAN